MRLKPILSFLALLAFHSFFAQTADFEWAKKVGGSGDDAPNAITVDANGDLYVTGYFAGTTDFDPSGVTVNLTAAGGTDIFVQKLSADGNLIWVKKMGGTNFEGGVDIALDPSGNIYITGYFYGTVDFDPGSGTQNLTSLGGADIFVQKLDPNGNFLWVKQMGGTADDFGRSITIAANGGVFSTGEFRNVVDFDPNGSTNFLYSFGSTNGYIQRLTTDGNYVWTKQIGGAQSCNSNAIELDAAGNVYTIGTFSGVSDFDPGSSTNNLTSIGSSDVFVLKLSNTGSFSWAKQMGAANGYSRGEAIALDPLGNVLTTGAFDGSCDFDPGTGVASLSSVGSLDVFIQKLDANGNYVWAKKFGGTAVDLPDAIVTDEMGNCYVTGYVEESGDFDPGPSTDSFTSFGGFDIFIEKLDTNGDYVWAKHIGGSDTDVGRGIAVDSDNNIYTTGFFSLTADFDPNSGVTNLSSAGSVDVFIIKLSEPDVTSLIETNFDSNLTLFPNPSSGEFSIDLGANYSDVLVTITNVEGQIIQMESFDQTTLIPLTLNAPAGLYFVRVQSENKQATLKTIKH